MPCSPPEVREAIAHEAVAWLDVGAEQAWDRVVGSDRPLARDRERFLALHAERTPLYESVADAIVPGHRSVVERALESLIALRTMPPETRMAWAQSASGGYPAYVGRGLIGAARPQGPGRAFVVTDDVVGELYGEAAGPGEALIEVAAGERSKSLAEAERILRELTALGATRSDHVVALGGGVVGDLAGFCAAVYQRGIAVVAVPTTLVAQVDSAYGGKTGVDLPEAKNYVGAYHLPAAVFADPATLATLPPAELAAGFVEVVKTALIAGGGLWQRVRSLEALEPRQLTPMIFACARTKLAIVGADERDAGLRQVLNLGHTVGHAIETALGLHPLPPRRGGRAWPARRAAALGRRRASRRGHGDPSPPPPAAGDRSGDHARGGRGRNRARQEAHRRGRRLRPLPRAGRAERRRVDRAG